MIHSIQCLLDAGVITQEQADELAVIMGKLPSGPSELLKLIAALKVTGGSGGAFEGATAVNGDYTAVADGNNLIVLRVTEEAVITINDGSPNLFWVDNDSGGDPVSFAADGVTVSGFPLIFTEGSVMIYRDGNDFKILHTGEINTVSNAGTDADGVALAKPKVGVDTPIKRMKAAVGSGRYLEFDDYIEYHKEGDLLTEAEAYQLATSITDEDAKAMDDFYLMMKGQPSYLSTRGTAWETLSEDVFTTKLITGHIFLSAFNFGSGVTVQAVKGALHGTINGGMAWGADGFTFDGVDDFITLGVAALVTGEFGIMMGATNTFGGTMALAGQNNSDNGRFSLSYAAGALQIFHHDGVASQVAVTATSDASASQKFVFARQTSANGLQIFRNGETTAPGTQTDSTAPPTAFSNTAFVYGMNGIFASQKYSQKQHFGLVFSGNILAADAAKIKTAMNNIFGLTMV